MENITSTIERIKYQEQQNDTASFLNAAICDATVEAKKSEREQERLIKSTDSLRRQKMLLECRRDALSAHVNSLKKELIELRIKANEDISKVWEMRSSFCKDIYAAADACDVWSLLMKPACAEPVSRNVQKEKLQVPTASENENRLQVAIERRAKALAERDRLATEPDNGEEFMRIKDALRYSLDRIAEINK